MKLPLNTESLAKQINVRSAVNPSLWACAVISLPLFVLATQTKGVLPIIFVVIGSLPILAFFFSYIYLLFKNPSYLRSEEYQLKAEVLKCFGDKDNPMSVTAEDMITVITNPKLPIPDSQPDSIKQLPNPNPKSNE